MTYVIYIIRVAKSLSHLFGICIKEKTLMQVAYLSEYVNAGI